jgi:hypothetical protein
LQDSKGRLAGLDRVAAAYRREHHFSMGEWPAINENGAAHLGKFVGCVTATREGHCGKDRSRRQRQPASERRLGNLTESQTESG